MSRVKIIFKIAGVVGGTTCTADGRKLFGLTLDVRKVSSKPEEFSIKRSFLLTCGWEIVTPKSLTTTTL